MAGFTAEQVEEVRMVIRMLPVFLTTILYWTIYAQVLPCRAPGRPHCRQTCQAPEPACDLPRVMCVRVLGDTWLISLSL